MSTNVNVPTNVRQREKDIDNKLRLYGIYQAFTAGKVPSNKQIDVALSSLVSHKKLREPNGKLSDEGKVLLEDFRTVVEEAKRLLLVKNHDEALQEFIFETTQLGQKGGPSTSTPNAPVSKETANRDGEEALEGLKVLGRLMITNGQFRKLISDVGILFRDIAGDVATKSAGKLRPDEERLRSIDDPAPDHEWHDAPDFNKQSMKQQLRDTFNKKSPLDENQLCDVAGNVTQAADPHGSRDPRETANKLAAEQRNGGNAGINAQAGVQQGIHDVKENIPEDQKQRAREYRERTNRYLQNKMPKERREQTIWRLKKMIVEIQSHRDYQQAIDTLLRLAETYTGHGKNIAGQTQGTVKGAHQDSHLKQAETHLRILLERFANNTSSEDFFDALNDIYRDADRDPELKNWFKSLDSFIRRSLKQDGYILTEDCNREYNVLYDHGNYLLRDRYRGHTDRLLNEVKFFGQQFAEDPQNNRFGDAMQKLFQDLGTDENGNAAFKKHLIKDITQVIIPDIFQSVRYVPIPRIEYSDPMADAVIENLVLESDNLMPNMLEISSDTYARFGRKTVSSKKTQQVMVSASGIQADLRDVSYYIKKKQGFPSLTDMGVADIGLGGEGFSFKLQLSTAEKHDRARFFKVDTCTVNIKQLKIKLKQSKHKALFSIFKPLLMGLVKPVMVKVLEQQIRSAFGRLDALSYRVYNEQEKIKRDLQNNPDPEHAMNLYQRYTQAIQKEALSRKERVKAKTADKKVNMAVTAEDSIFKDIKLPGGISTKATEYRQQARQGEGWKNDIFSIGHTSPTTGLPHPEKITRKSPHAQRRHLKEGVPVSSRDSGYEPSGYGQAAVGQPPMGYQQPGEYGQGYERGYTTQPYGAQEKMLPTQTQPFAQGPVLNKGTVGNGYTTTGQTQQYMQPNQGVY
ncbi:hypothetical protein EX30DRAFT_323876 [Ascodesmis nigricans]|uniref:Uncharacterized protein n=1 Tax=Ascodesmis nigricans TaxID=341454 RepID=A0A4S2MK46_9PEZI|nr:hypothetical protein EX30DRAFT_323876 [Ascodesmis nigricans]